MCDWWSVPLQVLCCWQKVGLSTDLFFKWWSVKRKEEEKVCWQKLCISDWWCVNKKNLCCLFDRNCACVIGDVLTENVCVVDRKKQPVLWPMLVLIWICQRFPRGRSVCQFPFLTLYGRSVVSACPLTRYHVLEVTCQFLLFNPLWEVTRQFLLTLYRSVVIPAF